jgi:hypothetical protein
MNKPFITKVAIYYARIEDVMNDEDKKRSGLANLSSDNLAALNEWLDKSSWVGEGPKPNDPNPIPKPPVR